MTRLQHYNSTVRQEAVRELKEILSLHSGEVLRVYLNSLLQGICSLSLDKERAIRRESLKVLNIILSPISTEQLDPFVDILLSYLNCCMTHINPSIKEDSLLFLDVLIQNCSGHLAKRCQKILPNFLEMISKLRTESQPGRQLITNLNSRNTSVKWRIKVLTSLEKILTAVLQNMRRKKLALTTNVKTVFATEKMNYAPLYSNNLQICELDFNKEKKVSEELDSEEFDKYVDGLWPLLFDSWLEICPRERKFDEDSLISNEAATFLKNILDIFQAFIELLEYFEYEENKIESSLKIKKKFYGMFVKNLVKSFPYEEKNASQQRIGKRQEDISLEKVVMNCGNCLEQNLQICRIFIWLTTIQEKKNRSVIDKTICEEILQFLNGETKILFI